MVLIGSCSKSLRGPLVRDASASGMTHGPAPAHDPGGDGARGRPAVLSPLTSCFAASFSALSLVYSASSCASWVVQGMAAAHI
jgi:hypothetical protein